MLKFVSFSFFFFFFFSFFFHFSFFSLFSLSYFVFYVVYSLSMTYTFSLELLSNPICVSVFACFNQKNFPGFSLKYCIFSKNPGFSQGWPPEPPPRDSPPMAWSGPSWSGFGNARQDSGIFDQVAFFSKYWPDFWRARTPILSPWLP